MSSLIVPSARSARQAGHASRCSPWLRRRQSLLSERSGGSARRLLTGPRGGRPGSASSQGVIPFRLPGWGASRPRKQSPRRAWELAGDPPPPVQDPGSKVGKLTPLHVSPPSRPHCPGRPDPRHYGGGPEAPPRPASSPPAAQVQFLPQRARPALHRPRPSPLAAEAPPAHPRRLHRPRPVPRRLHRPRPAQAPPQSAGRGGGTCRPSRRRRLLRELSRQDPNGCARGAVRRGRRRRGTAAATSDKRQEAASGEARPDARARDAPRGRPPAPLMPRGGR
ncbi:proline-rich protein HaeIII subfamily 1-like [Elephas maximus indicus]|uniref:proline-rich protein HaeIII subfamily 1-like n=1 Tax=Elephas maximus indicus TaxID=99487 RepID=UPI0021164AA7|nr:proline-rich protein HaeIII subfamily 1-like [Elephas maximus indicus]